MKNVETQEGIISESDDNTVSKRKTTKMNDNIKEK